MNQIIKLISESSDAVFPKDLFSDYFGCHKNISVHVPPIQATEWMGKQQIHTSYICSYNVKIFISELYSV